MLAQTYIPPTVIIGRCLCGYLTVHVQWPAASPLKLRVCDCDYCNRQGASWICDHVAPITLRCSDLNEAVVCRFASENADFLICGRCGVLIRARGMLAGGERAVVNANTFENIELAQCQRIAARFTNENLDTRLARREADWSPLITLT